MRMPKHQDLRPDLFNEFLIAILKLVQFAEDMTNHYSASAQDFQPFVRKFREVIVVPINREYWCDGLQALDYFELADISGVDDRVHAVEDRRY